MKKRVFNLWMSDCLLLLSAKVSYMFACSFTVRVVYLLAVFRFIRSAHECAVTRSDVIVCLFILHIESCV